MEWFKNLLKNDVFQFAAVLAILMGFMYYRSSSYYDHLLKDTKLQIHKRQQVPKQ
jgi:hypothetical protein